MEIETQDDELFWRGQFALLTANYLRSASEIAESAAQSLYRGAVERAVWLTPSLLNDTVEWVVAHVDGPLPTVAAFLDYARAVAAQRARVDAAAAPAALQLPSAAPDQDDWERQVATARAEQRERFRLMTVWRNAQLAKDPTLPRHLPIPESVWKGKEYVTEEAIQGVLAEMTAARASRLELKRVRQGGRGAHSAVPSPVGPTALRLGLDLLPDHGKTSEKVRRGATVHKPARRARPTPRAATAEEIAAAEERKAELQRQIDGYLRTNREQPETDEPARGDGEETP